MSGRWGGSLELWCESEGFLALSRIGSHNLWRFSCIAAKLTVTLTVELNGDKVQSLGKEILNTRSLWKNSQGTFQDVEVDLEGSRLKIGGTFYSLALTERMP